MPPGRPKKHLPKSPRFRVIRVCCVCNREAPRMCGSSRKRSDVIILAITPIVYFWPAGRAASMTKNALRIRICEECLAKALTTGRLPWAGDEAVKLWEALQGSLLELYEAMKQEADLGAPAPRPPVPDGMLPLSTEGSLFGTYEVLTGTGRDQAK